MSRVRLTEQQKKIRERRILELYQSGAPYRVISAELHVGDEEIRRVAKEAGCWVKGRQGITNQKTNAYKITEQTEENESCAEKKTRKRRREAVDIDLIRSEIKVGDRIKMRTSKGMTIDADLESNIRGVVRDAVVISKASPVFCLVRLVKSGVLDSVRWSDMYVAWRDGKEVIG